MHSPGQSSDLPDVESSPPPHWLVAPAWRVGPAIINAPLEPGVTVAFSTGSIQGAPLPDATFDIVVGGESKGPEYEIQADDVGREVFVRGRAANAAGFSIVDSASILVTGGQERAYIDGKILRSTLTHEELILRGINQGTWGENYPGDAANIVALGATVVRIVALRWSGDSYGPGVDAYSPNEEDDFIDPAHLAQGLNDVDMAVAEDLWVVVTLDSDNGAGNRGLGNGQWNFFEPSAEGALMLSRYKTASRRIIRELASRPRILFVELLAEPLPRGSTADWAPTVTNLYRDLIANKLTVDLRTLVMIGPRSSYGVVKLREVYLPERNDVVYTVDMLSGKVSDEGDFQLFVHELSEFRDTYNVPVFGNQLGRRTGDDIGDVDADGVADTTDNIGLTAMCGAMSAFNARGIPFTWWQYVQNTANPLEYALYPKLVYPGDGPDNRVPKVAEIAVFSYHMTQTKASVKAEALQGFSAVNDRWFEIEDDLSNVFQDAAGTIPLTIVGQPIGRINERNGHGYLSQVVDELRPTLERGPNGWVFQCNGSQYLDLDSPYFASGDNVIVIAAGRSEPGNTNRVVFHCGKVGSGTARKGYLAILGDDMPIFSMRGDDAVERTCKGAMKCDARAVVLRGKRTGSTKRLWVNGVREGVASTDAEGSIAVVDLARVGADAAGLKAWNGKISLVVLSKTMTDGQCLAVDRYGAWRSGAAFRGPIPGAEQPIEPPTLADIAAYQQSSTAWADVPWGPGSWAEPTLGGATLYQRLDIAIPSTAAPVGGYPVILWFHANAASKTVGAGSNVDTYVKQPALAAGFAFVSVEFRHPVVNEASGSPHTDTGLAIQFTRSLHEALNLDRSKFYAVAQSRGTLALWQTLQADMANAVAGTYAERQSSRLQGVWGIQGQIAYGSQRFADLYVVEADRAAVVAEHPDNAAWKNAIDDVPTVDALPQLVMIHEAAYFGAQVSKATLDGMGSEYVHFPDAGRLLRDAYQARSAAALISVYDSEASAAERLGDMVTWVKYLIEGLNSAEAFAMARALRRGAQAHYVADDWAGMAQNSDGSGAPALNGVIGAITAAQYGYANRLLGLSALGYGAGQTTTANKPRLVDIGNGHFGIGFVDSTDRLSVGMPSDGTPNWRGWTLTGEVTTLSGQTTGNYTFGQAPLAGRTLALSIGSDAAITTNDLKVYRQFATLLAGVAYP